MNGTVQGVLTVAGRVCLSAIFLLAAVGNKIPHFGQVAGVMRQAAGPTH